MVTIERLKQLDHDYSYKLATIFGMDSRVRRFFQIITVTGTFFTWAIVLAVAYFYNVEKQIEIATISIIFGIMIIPVFTIKHVVRRSRPSYKDDRFGTVAFDKYSFPSGHATRATYAMIMMPFYMPNYTILWIIWGLTMIASRLILGVHYISDILTGILIGSVFMIFFIIIDWIPVIPFIENLIG